MSQSAERRAQGAEESTDLLPSALCALRSDPAPLTRAQRITFAIFTIVIALTRIPALSLTLHDWDETLFAFGVHEYDVKPHHPHPPGYPLFVAAAKVARLFTDSDFHATQTVATIASMLLFPVAFLLARELRFRVPYAFAAAAMTAFLPSIWYYGGTGLSDVPALMLILLASALLLRGGRDPRAYFAGAVVTALACGIRPHLLMTAAAPALLGFLAERRLPAGRYAGILPAAFGRTGPPGRRRSGRLEAGAPVFAASWLAAAAIVFITYTGAAFFSSDFPNGYLKEVRYIQKHIRQSDSYHNPYRTPLRELAPRVFLFPSGGGRAKLAIVILGAIALIDAIVRRRWNIAAVLAMFLPIAIFTWFMLDMTALSRYAIAYLPMHAFLAVAGAEALAQLAPSRARLPLFVVLAGFVTWSLIKWTWPALRFARTEPSPVVAAFQWIRANVPKNGPRVFVQGGLVYHANYFIPDYDYQLIFDERKWENQDFAPGNIYVFEGETQHPEPRWFRRKRLQLWEITRPRFFEIGIVPMHRIIRWGRGWYLPEGEPENRWRWMARESRTYFAPALYGRGELHLKLHAPVDVTPRPPVITVMWNGAVIDRRTAPSNGDFDLTYTLPSRNEGANELRIATDETIQPKDDARVLGLSLHAISWREPRGGG